MINEKDIDGVRLKFSIKFNKDDDREYIEKVAELQDKITDVINELQHNFMIGSGEPIVKSEIIYDNDKWKLGAS